MTDRAFTHVRTPAASLVTIAGRFKPDTANDPTTIVGEGFTVVHTATGKWTVTTTKKCEQVVSFVAHLVSASLLGHLRSSSVPTVDGTSKLASAEVTYLSWVPATPTFTAADIVAGANEWIEFVMVVSDIGANAAG